MISKVISNNSSLNNNNFKLTKNIHLNQSQVLYENEESKLTNYEAKVVYEDDKENSMKIKKSGL